MAALLVVMTHASGTGMLPELPFGPWGGNGVAIFFVLSGYLIWKPFVARRPDTGTYLLRRSARILPGYWLAAIGLTYLAGGDLLRTLVMFPSPATFLGVVWTLRAEVMFYAIVPLLAVLGRPVAVPLVFGLFSLVADYGLGLMGGRGTSAEALIVFRFWSFALGMLLAALVWRPGHWALALGVVLLCVGAATNSAVWETQHFNLATYGGAFFVVAWCIRARIPLAPFWAAGAAISYGLYLWHADLIKGFGWVGLALAVVIACGSYVFVERPVIRWAHRSRRVDDRRVLGAASVPSHAEREEEPAPRNVVVRPRTEEVGRGPAERALPEL
jgi:peptidoglycan/LPS O-acetylase OafA/YrhL